jgi:diguanylate cyclase (GGDEF)-like protein/PAS domain S-box-containing protein
MKLFITFVVYGTLLAFSTQLLVLDLNEKSIKKEAITHAADFALKSKDDLNTYLQGMTQKLYTIEDSKLFHKFYAHNDKDDIDQLFLDVSKNTPNIMQIRYIDLAGNEITRVERDHLNSSPFIVPKEKLQNKANRYYFKAIIKLKKSQSWYSKLDLNIEHKKIEKPLKPVIRLGIPLFVNGEKKGIFIINVFMKEFLKQMTKSRLYQVYLIDKDGYIMIEPSHKNCWNRYLHHTCNLPSEFKNNLKKILHNDKVITDSFVAQKIFTKNDEDIRIIVIPNTSTTQEKINKYCEQLLWILFIIALFSLPLSYFFAITPSKLKEEVDELNETLTDEVKQRDILLSLFELSDSVLFKWNCDDSWSVSSVSKSVKSLVGYTKEDFETKKVQFSECIHKEDYQRVICKVEEAVREEKYFFTHEPYRITTKLGEIRWILEHTVIVRDKNDVVTHFVGYLSDITDLKEKEFTLEKQARTDQLTQIYNRMYIDEVLKNQYYRYQRNNEPCCVILVDIDYFKSVNDEYGHIVGDKVLIEFARLLKSSIREGDVLGRWGGEEFLIILPHITKEKAALLAEKLRQIVEKNVFPEVVTKTASFGVACFQDGISIEKLIDNADMALYKAKENGRNNVQVY